MLVKSVFLPQAPSGTAAPCQLPPGGSFGMLRSSFYTAKKLFTVVMVPCSTAASIRNSPDWL